MATGKPRDLRKERFWRATLEQWRRSGLSARAFCEQHDLSLPSLYAWRATLARRAAETPAFVPVQALPPDPPAHSSPAAGSGLELPLPSGLVLRLAPAFDAPTLRRLLALLQEDRP
jgi:hypothetical protein